MPLRAPAVSTAAPRHRFDVDDYYRMADAGILREGRRFELIDGEVVEMAAIGSRHAGCLNRINRQLSDRLRSRAVVAIQNPLRLSEYDEPEPDVVVCRPREDDYTASHPRGPDALLVIEVAESSVGYDRTTKAALYAGGGVPEYWVVDLDADLIRVNRAPSGDAWGSVEACGRDRELAVPGADGATVRVSDLLP